MSIAALENSFAFQGMQRTWHGATHWLWHSGHHGSIVALFSRHYINLQQGQDDFVPANHDRGCGLSISACWPDTQTLWLAPQAEKVWQQAVMTLPGLAEIRLRGSM